MGIAEEGAGGISVIAVKVTEADDGSGEEVFGFFRSRGSARCAVVVNRSIWE